MISDELIDIGIRITSVYAKLIRKWLGRSTLVDAVEEVFSVSIRTSIVAFSQRYGVGEDYRLPTAVKSDYNECVTLSSSAFTASLLGDKLSDDWIEAISRYLESDVVSFELSKLLEPGVEEFDIRALTKGFFDQVHNKYSSSLSESEVWAAWTAFQKAFSFASRARPDLREFIRASYEEGSFNALTDIKHIVDRMEQDGENLLAEEDKLDASMKEYKDELLKYRDWAKNFGSTKPVEH